MKKCSYLCQYLTKCFLEWEILKTKDVEKIKTHTLCPITFFRKSCPLWGNVKKYGGAREGTDDNMAHVLSCWIRLHERARVSTCSTTHVRTNTHTNMEYLLLFHGSATAFRSSNSFTYNFIQIICRFLRKVVRSVWNIRHRHKQDGLKKKAVTIKSATDLPLSFVFLMITGTARV